MASGDFRDLPNEQLLIVLSNKAFSIAKKPKYDEYQRGFSSMV